MRKSKGVVMTDRSMLVVYTDGSSQPNPGFAGYGVYGYVLKPAKRPRSINYPVKTGFKYTSKGILRIADIPEEIKDESFECTVILEHIGSINDDSATNNQAEVLGLLTALEAATHIEDLGSILLITDSKYALLGYKSYRGWEKNGWRNSSGREMKNIDLWERFGAVDDRLEELGIEVKTEWVKGHEDTEGNVVADLYALIGTNYARNQLTSGITTDFDESCLSRITSITKFKKEIEDRHLLLDYKSALFYTLDTGDDEIMYLASTFNPMTEKDLGKRNISATYAMLVNDIPESYKGLRRSFRNINRPFNQTAMMNLDTVKKDKMLTRIMTQVGFEPIVVKVNERNINKFMAFNRDGVIVEELNYEYTHLYETYQTLQALEYSFLNYDQLLKENILVDITDELYDTEKKQLKFKFNDKDIDLTDKINLEGKKATSRLTYTFGMDSPSSTTMKSFEKKIKGIFVHPNDKINSSLLTLVTIVVYENEEGKLSYLLQTNLLGKYLIK